MDELRTLPTLGATNAFDVDANSAAATTLLVETIVVTIVDFKLYVTFGSVDIAA